MGGLYFKYNIDPRIKHHKPKNHRLRRIKMRQTKSTSNKESMALLKSQYPNECGLYVEFEEKQTTFFSYCIWKNRT